MARLLSTREPVRVVPPGDEVRAYVLRTPTVYDRARLRRACLARGARFWSEVEMMAALSMGVRALLGDESDEGQRLLADIETHNQHLVAGTEPDPKAAQRIADIEAAVTRGHAPYAERLADRSFWQDILPIEAVRLLLVGWEGVNGAAPHVGSDGVAEADLARIPPDHLPWLGLKALGLFAPAEDEEKNSSSPPPGPPDPTTSPAASPTPPTTP